MLIVFRVRSLLTRGNVLTNNKNVSLTWLASPSDGIQRNTAIEPNPVPRRLIFKKPSLQHQSQGEFVLLALPLAMRRSPFGRFCTTQQHFVGISLAIHIATGQRYGTIRVRYVLGGLVFAAAQGPLLEGSRYSLRPWAFVMF